MRNIKFFPKVEINQYIANKKGPVDLRLPDPKSLSMHTDRTSHGQEFTPDVPPKVELPGHNPLYIGV